MKNAFSKATAILLVAVVGCAEHAQPWPFAGTPSQHTRANAVLADYCPKPGATVGRRRVQDGANIAPLVYVQATGTPPCTVALGGGTAQYLDLLGMTAFQVDERSNVFPIARAVSELFPLHVGKGASATVMGNTRSGDNFAWRFDFEVVAGEHVSIPAGQYYAYVVRVTERGLPPNTFHVERAVWIEPGSRLPIRVRNRPINAHPSAVFVDWDATFIRQ
jgi:hypothetical protein